MDVSDGLTHTRRRNRTFMHTPKIIDIMIANAYLCLDSLVLGDDNIPQKLPVIPYPLPHGGQLLRR